MIPESARTIPRISSLRSFEISNRGGRGSAGLGAALLRREGAALLGGGAADFPGAAGGLADGLATGLEAGLAGGSSLWMDAGLLLPLLGVDFTKGNLNPMGV